jgi:hypothetical protein
MPVAPTKRTLRNWQEGRRLSRDASAMTTARARCLNELVRRPEKYTQRFVEELSFVEGGGQKWTRNLQIRIPNTDITRDTTWWIVSLGPFARRRFPDLRVTGSAGAPVKLVSRQEHGMALTTAILGKPLHHIRKDKNRRRALNTPEGRKALKSVYRLLVEFYTEIGNTGSREASAKAVVSAYRELLRTVGFSDQTLQPKLEDFAEALADLITSTQYLCWVRAAPGGTLHLEASHTARDPKHKADQGNIQGLVASLWIGVTGLRPVTKEERDAHILDAPLAGRPAIRHYFGSLPVIFDRAARSERQADWFRQYGLAPINYEFNVPTYRYATSYYATLAPPRHTLMTHVDWEIDNSFNNHSEVDCALHSIHVYNPLNEAGREKTFRTTRAYVRSSPHHHKQILIAAALNFAVVWLLVKGQLLGNRVGPLQELVVASPSIWVAFLAQQQRHYYAHALRRSRAILWAYLLIALAFLVAAASSDLNSSAHLDLTLGVKITAWLLAITSIGVIVWNVPLGHGYDRMVRFLRNRKYHAIREPQKLGPIGAFTNDLWWIKRQNERIDTSWKCYEAAYESYSRLIWRAAACSMIGGIIVLDFVLHLRPY